MSRSRRRTPITGITTAESEKQFKAAEHRRERSAVKQAVSAGRELLDRREYGNPWIGDKDGKRWHGDRSPELMRK